MRTILNEIEGALNANLYYAAIALTLTLPDVCAALEHPTGKSNGNRFKTWWRQNLAENYPQITDVDMWMLRNGVVHQGRFGPEGMQYSRILFTIPNPQRNVYHRNIVNDALNLHAEIFCQDVMDAVRQWLIDKADDPTVLRNLPNLLTLRPEGMAPLGNMPLIA